MFTVEIGTSPAASWSCDKPDPELLQTSCFSTGFANGHYSVAPSASWGLPTIWIGVWRSKEDNADGAPYHFLNILDREQMWKMANTVEMASLNMEMMMWRWVVCGTIGEVVHLVKFAWIRACVKAKLPDHPDQQAKKRMGIYGSCMLNVLLVLEYSVSTCL